MATPSSSPFKGASRRLPRLPPSSFVNVPDSSPSEIRTMGSYPTRLAIPPSHFLAQPRVSLPPANDLPPPSARPDTTTLASADYDVDVRSGFLPPAEPLARLPPGPWSVWEDAWDSTDGLRVDHTSSSNAKTCSWRLAMGQMPVVHAQSLDGRVELLRRAHAVLAFLTHAWVHTSDRSAAGGVKVLEALAVPLCEVSEMLDVPAVLTYSDTVLYNWRLRDPAMGFTAANIEMPLNFTRTASEEHFYKISFLVETLGPACLALMRASLDEAFVADQLSVRRITDNLTGLAALTHRIKETLEKTREGCDPRTFYWEIRPWFNGGRWIMQGVPPRKGDEVSSEGWRVSDLGGPSAGQSTLIHSLDVFLGVDHRPRPAGSEAVGAHATIPLPSSSTAEEETFMTRMSAYMPHHHRRFLAHLSASLAPSSTVASFPHVNQNHSVRSLAAATPAGSPTRSAYDNVVHALEDLRKSHSRTALLYIVSQSRVAPPEGSAYVTEWQAKMEAEWVRGEARRTGADDGDGMPQAASKDVHKGTGGTDLAKFLKRCRERTKEALLGNQPCQ